VFGRPSGNHDHGTPQRPPAAEVARIQGGGLVQLVITSVSPMTFFLFLNDQAVPQIDVESLSVAIEAPDGSDSSGAIARATLTRYVKTVSSTRSEQSTELFPCTVEIIALERRITLTCLQVDSLDGLWISLGLKPDGSSAEVSGAKSLQILLTDEILSAKLTWMDGETEDLLPQSALS
jgi:hypothetical protein